MENGRRKRFVLLTRIVLITYHPANNPEDHKDHAGGKEEYRHKGQRDAWVVFYADEDAWYRINICKNNL